MKAKEYLIVYEISVTQIAFSKKQAVERARKKGIVPKDQLIKISEGIPIN